MMIRRLTSRLKRYDRSRRALFEELATLPPEKLTEIDGPGKWSILQVVQHMIRAESSVLQNRPDPTRLLPKNLSMRAHLGYLAVLFVLLFDIPVPVPDSGMAPNDNDLSLKKLKNEWDQNIVWLKDYINHLTTTSAKQAVFSHPVTGPLTPARALRIAQLHLNTHKRHIARIRHRITRTTRTV